MKVRRSVLKDTVVVRTRLGESSYGDTYADPVTVPCLLDETRRLVRASNGQETVSEVTLVLHPRSYVKAANGSVTVQDPMELFTAESEIEYRGRTTRVMSSKENRMRGYTVSVGVTCE